MYIERLILPEIRKIVRKKIEPTNKGVNDASRKIDDIKMLVNERFKAANEHLGALRERYNLEKEVIALRAKVGDLKSRFWLQKFGCLCDFATLSRLLVWLEYRYFITIDSC